MFFCGKRIIYLNCYKENIKGAAAGFVRLVESKERCRIELSLRRICWPDGEYRVCLEGEEDKLELGEISLKSGEASGCWHLSQKGEYINYRGVELPAEKFYRIVVFKNLKEHIEGHFGETAPCKRNTSEKIEIEAEEMQDAHIEQQEVLPECRCEYSVNKWIQLQSFYKTVHPFGDTRTFISIEPKDFVILQAPYQKLVNNSFLLHGFYNYRHVILGPCSGLEIGAEDRFYLGVPGTFHEREKMVAVMFGFEGFECSGSVESGKFGYYMRRVEL